MFQSSVNTGVLNMANNLLSDEFKHVNCLFNSVNINGANIQNSLRGGIISSDEARRYTD